MSLGDLVGVVGGVLSIIMLSGGVVVFFKASYNRARIDALRQDIDDYRNRQEQCDRQHSDDEKRIEKCEDEIKHLTDENHTLRELVLQRVEIHGLGDLLTMHHQEAMVYWKHMTEAMEQLNDQQGR